MQIVLFLAYYEADGSTNAFWSGSGARFLTDQIRQNLRAMAYPLEFSPLKDLTENQV